MVLEYIVAKSSDENFITVVGDLEVTGTRHFRATRCVVCPFRGLMGKRRKR
jgi:hypothetical protein